MTTKLPGLELPFIADASGVEGVSKDVLKALDNIIKKAGELSTKYGEELGKTLTGLDTTLKKVFGGLQPVIEKAATATSGLASAMGGFGSQAAAALGAASNLASAFVTGGLSSLVVTGVAFAVEKVAAAFAEMETNAKNAAKALETAFNKQLEATSSKAIKAIATTQALRKQLRDIGKTSTEITALDLAEGEGDAKRRLENLKQFRKEQEAVFAAAKKDYETVKDPGFKIDKERIAQAKEEFETSKKLLDSAKARLTRVQTEVDENAESQKIVKDIEAAQRRLAAIEKARLANLKRINEANKNFEKTFQEIGKLAGDLEFPQLSFTGGFGESTGFQTVKGGQSFTTGFNTSGPATSAPGGFGSARDPLREESLDTARKLSILGNDALKGGVSIGKLAGAAKIGTNAFVESVGGGAGVIGIGIGLFTKQFEIGAENLAKASEIAQRGFQVIGGGLTAAGQGAGEALSTLAAATGLVAAGLLNIAFLPGAIVAAFAGPVAVFGALVKNTSSFADTQQKIQDRFQKSIDLLDPFNEDLFALSEPIGTSIEAFATLSKIMFDTLPILPSIFYGLKLLGLGAIRVAQTFDAITGGKNQKSLAEAFDELYFTDFNKAKAKGKATDNALEDIAVAAFDASAKVNNFSTAIRKAEEEITNLPNFFNLEAARRDVAAAPAGGFTPSAALAAGGPSAVAGGNTYIQAGQSTVRDIRNGLAYNQYVQAGGPGTADASIVFDVDNGGN